MVAAFDVRKRSLFAAVVLVVVVVVWFAIAARQFYAARLPLRRGRVVRHLVAYFARVVVLVIVTRFVVVASLLIVKGAIGAFYVAARWQGASGRYVSVSAFRLVTFVRLVAVPRLQ